MHTLLDVDLYSFRWATVSYICMYVFLDISKGFLDRLAQGLYMYVDVFVFLDLIYTIPANCACVVYAHVRTYA